MARQHLALIIGAGSGLSASLARLFAREGLTPVLAARNTEKLASLARETGGRLATCDASKAADVSALFHAVEGRLDIAVYNPSFRVRGPLTEVDPDQVRKAIDITAFGAFLFGQASARRMLEQEPVGGKRGTIMFTGASAGVKGFAKSASFAMGKFAQRGLAQSMSRELHPQGIHVAWINIDGAIRNPEREQEGDRPDSMLDPDAIANSYLALHRQDRSAWSSELTVRPWVEHF